MNDPTNKYEIINTFSKIVKTYNQTKQQIKKIEDLKSIPDMEGLQEFFTQANIK